MQGYKAGNSRPYQLCSAAAVQSRISCTHNQLPNMLNGTQAVARQMWDLLDQVAKMVGALETIITRDVRNACRRQLGAAEACA